MSNASTSALYPDISYDEVINAVSTFPLVNIPYEYPVYSNTGMDLLGLANVAANKLASAVPADEPQTHKELVKRDIFDPLGMHASFFRVPDDAALRRHIAIPSKDAEWADIPLGDVSDSAGGQYSSLADLVTIMKTLLSPTARGGLIPAGVVREWLRPLHTWGSGGQEVGAPWEITTLADAKAYTKGRPKLFPLFTSVLNAFFRRKSARIPLRIRTGPRACRRDRSSRHRRVSRHVHHSQGGREAHRRAHREAARRGGREALRRHVGERRGRRGG